jgi:hypothetical protein
MIKYETSVEFIGNLDSAINMAKNIFATNGFKMNQIDQTKLSVTGPGMNSTKQNPIRGLSRGELNFTGETLEFKGELGGIAFVKKFLKFFPLALGTGMTVFFVGLLYFTRQNILFGFIPLLAVAPWLFISPVISRRIQKKTEDAIATTLENISKA